MELINRSDLDLHHLFLNPLAWGPSMFCCHLKLTNFHILSSFLSLVSLTITFFSFTIWNYPNSSSRLALILVGALAWWFQKHTLWVIVSKGFLARGRSLSCQDSVSISKSKLNSFVVMIFIVCVWNFKASDGFHEWILGMRVQNIITITVAMTGCMPFAYSWTNICRSRLINFLSFTG